MLILHDIKHMTKIKINLLSGTKAVLVKDILRDGSGDSYLSLNYAAINLVFWGTSHITLSLGAKNRNVLLVVTASPIVGQV